MTEHTPGPWKIIEKDPGYGTVLAYQVWADCYGNPDANMLAIVSGRGYFSNKVAEANACLIAAAPALVEACDLAYRWLTGGPDDPLARGVSLMELIDRLGQALAAARQEASR